LSDINNDGKPDLIAGNLGHNSKFKTEIQQPVMLYAGDFDGNGKSETITTLYKTDGRAYPLHLRGDLIAQMPALKKKFLLHKDYGGKGIDQVLSENQLRSAQQYRANYFTTTVFINQGKTRFIRGQLPVQAQFSPVYAIETADFNKDGKMDLFLSGNFAGLKPELGRYDANYGQVYTGDGKGGFNILTSGESGIILKGESRDAVLFNNRFEERYLLVTINNESPEIFKLNK